MYQQIAADLLSRMSAGEWQIGDQFPSESILCEEYASSRVTIRQALAKLEYEGFLDRQRGKGSFIKANPSIVIQELFIPQVGARRKSNIHSENIKFSVVTDANPQVLKYLHIDAGTPVVYLSRLFVQHGRAIGINNAWFPLDKVQGITELPLINNSVTDTLQSRYGIRFSSIDNYIESLSMAAETAHALSTSFPSPGLKISSVYYAEDNSPVEYAVTIWNGRDTQFHLVLSQNK
jgi:DNA-binding GntR family transcriptional regulator